MLGLLLGERSKPFFFDVLSFVLTVLCRRIWDLCIRIFGIVFQCLFIQQTPAFSDSKKLKNVRDNFTSKEPILKNGESENINQEKLASVQDSEGSLEIAWVRESWGLHAFLLV